MQRTAIVIVVSDGDGIPAEPEARAKVTKVGRGRRQEERAHPRPRASRRAKARQARSSTLGELSKQSGGTFRWVQDDRGLRASPLEQLVDQLARQVRGHRCWWPRSTSWRGSASWR
jgi:hypothetical protein